MNRLLPEDLTFPTLEHGAPHQIARTAAPDSYPPRAASSDAWSQVGPEYQPQEYTHPKILEQPPWADPPEFEQARARRGEQGFLSYEPLLSNPSGRPRNPRGPTGLRGRGLLGSFGANFAADPIVFRLHQSQLEMVAIQRRDNGLWAIPGGMVDSGEQVSATLARELAEEALGKQASPEQVARWEKELGQLFSERGVEVYRGYVDDFRNTDEAWMETSAFYLLITPEMGEQLNWDLTLVAGDDAADTRWMTVSRNELDRMHANHSEIVGRAVQILEQRENLVFNEEGRLMRASSPAS